MYNNFSLIVTAGGESLRFGGKIKKQFYNLAGKPILFWTLDAFKNIIYQKNTILTLPNENFSSNCKFFYKIYPELTIVEGGKSRTHSVYNALKRIKNKSDYIVIHDGVRPCVSKNIILSVIKKTTKYGAAIPVLPPSNSLKKISGNFIIKSIDRNSIFSVSTPQGFLLKELKLFYKKIDIQNNSFPDDSSIFELFNKKVATVFDRSTNIKITTKDDLIIANAILKANK